jgi:hypothetical protein
LIEQRPDAERKIDYNCLVLVVEQPTHGRSFEMLILVLSKFMLDFAALYCTGRVDWL